MSALRKPKLQVARRYTYADYCTWDDDERWELIDGVPYAMAAPLIMHQSVSGNIHLQIGNFLHIKKCMLYLKTGVREYWIVDPVTGTVIVNILEGDKYVAGAYEKTKVIPVSVLEGCSVDLAEVFIETEELE